MQDTLPAAFFNSSLHAVIKPGEFPGKPKIWRRVLTGQAYIVCTSVHTVQNKSPSTVQVKQGGTTVTQ